MKIFERGWLWDTGSGPRLGATITRTLLSSYAKGS